MAYGTYQSRNQLPAANPLRSIPFLRARQAQSQAMRFLNKARAELRGGRSVWRRLRLLLRYCACSRRWRWPREHRP